MIQLGLLGLKSWRRMDLTKLNYFGLCAACMKAQDRTVLHCIMDIATVAIGEMIRSHRAGLLLSYEGFGDVTCSLCWLRSNQSIHLRLPFWHSLSSFWT